MILDLFRDYIFEIIFHSGGVLPVEVFYLWMTSLSFSFLSIILGTFYIFVRYTYNINDIERPIYEARLLTKGFFWKIVGVLIINMIIGIIFFYPFVLIYQYLIMTVFQDFYVEAHMPPSNYILKFLFNVIYDLPTIILGPLQICLITPLFTHQYLKRENIILAKKL